MTEPKKKAKEWLQEPFDKETQRITQDLLDADNEELVEAFHDDLAFGTGGMRGIMGVGTNRINRYTLGKNTQGVSNYLHETISGQGGDQRCHSLRLQKEQSFAC